MLCSNGWDHDSTEIWGYAVTKEEAEEWVKQTKFQDDRWNGCNFDEKIKIDHDKKLMKLGMVDDNGKYDDSYAGSSYYIESEKIFPTQPIQETVEN